MCVFVAHFNEAGRQCQAGKLRRILRILSTLTGGQRSMLKRARSPDRDAGRRNVRRAVTRLPSAANLVRAMIPYGQTGTGAAHTGGDVDMASAGR